MIKSIAFLLLLSSTFCTIKHLNCSDWVIQFNDFSCQNESAINVNIINFLTFFVYKNNIKYLMKMSLPSEESKMELKILKNLKKKKNISQLIDFKENENYIVYIVGF